MIQMKRQYYIVSLILMLLSNRLLFYGARLFNAGLRHWDLSLPADAGIPFLPRMTLIYIGCYVWWLYVYWLITQRDRKDADRLFGANLLAKAVCFLIFVIFPTSVTRPELMGDSIWIFAVPHSIAADGSRGLLLHAGSPSACAAGCPRRDSAE